MKAIIFDSSTLINLTMNGLLDVLERLRKKFSGKFIITEDVRRETIERPSQIKKFELGALKIQALLDEELLEMPSSLGVSDEEIRARTREILNMVNGTFYIRNEVMHIIDAGEASCLALSEMLTRKKIDNVVAVDERTTRMLLERPDNLRKLYERKFHSSVRMRSDALLKMDVKMIRSSELMYVAWKRKLVELKNGKVLDALLYATKFKGSAISFEEIEELKRIG